MREPYRDFPELVPVNNYTASIDKVLEKNQELYKRLAEGPKDVETVRREKVDKDLQLEG